ACVGLGPLLPSHVSPCRDSTWRGLCLATAGSCTAVRSTFGLGGIASGGGRPHARLLTCPFLDLKHLVRNPRLSAQVRLLLGAAARRSACGRLRLRSVTDRVSAQEGGVLRQQHSWC